MMLHSTNRDTADVDFKTAILKGQALDRGLYMLNEIPKFNEDLIHAFKKLKINEIGHLILSAILGDSIPKEELIKIIDDALNFEVPVEKINEIDYMCYLDKGPTASFKDFGARTLARIIEYYLEKDNSNLIILTATSGDTGGAVAQAFHGMKRIKVVVLYPKNEISVLQRKQMTTLGNNITALGINGKFDNCQALVKKAFADTELKHLNLSSANSINIGRLIPQTLYYFWSYSRIVEKQGEKVIFSVPSGNFGNLMGGLIASHMGLPVKIFISAVNENDEFPQFIETGHYKKVEPSRKCISNAMNVGHPSNLARLIDLYGGHIDESGIIHEKPDMERIKREIISYSISDIQTKEAIGKFYKKYNKIIEPHGAVGWASLEKYRENYPEDNKFKAINFETADPAKFPDEIISLVMVNPKIPRSLDIIRNKEEITNIIEIKDYPDFKDFLLLNF